MKRAETISELKRLRLARGLTQTALAKAVGIVPAQVSMIESGRTKPGARMYPKLAKALGVSASEIVNIVYPKPTPGTTGDPKDRERTPRR